MRIYFIILLLILTVLIPAELHTQNLNELNIALVYPALTKEVLYKNDSSFIPTDLWELFFMSNHLKYEMIDDNSLDKISNNINIVVLPSLQVITESMIEEIDGLNKGGKGILITGDFAEFDENGNKASPEIRNRILAFQISQLSGINEISINHTLAGNTPFSIGMKPGVKILLNSKPKLYYASEIKCECSIAGNYIPVNGNFSDTLSGIISDSKTSGRLLWFGFNFDQLIGSNKDKLLLNSFNWLSSKPVVMINNLPGKYYSAGIIYRDIENTGEINLYDSLYKSEKINYFISLQLIENPGLKLKDFAYIGNINLIWDDFYFSKIPFGEKEEWLDKTRLSIKENTGQDYFGIYSFGCINDSSVYRYLKSAGYSFEFSSGYSDSFSFDYDSLNNIYSYLMSPLTGENYKSHLNFILKNDGIIYINTDSLCSKKVLDEYTNNENIWFTTFSDLLGWELKKERLNLTTGFTDNNYKIEIENNGSADIRDVGIWISIPGISGNLHIIEPDKSADLTFNYDKKMFYLNVNLIRSNQKLVFRIPELK